MSIPTAAVPEQVSVAHCLLDTAGEVLSERQGDQRFYAASTIKVHVLLTALQAADRGELDLDARVPATFTFAGVDGAPFTLGGDHLDVEDPPAGEHVAVRDLLERMITRSSNAATDHVVELLGSGDAVAGARGLEAVAAAIADLGLAFTRVERLIGDGVAVERGLTNETSAADLARTVHALLGTELLSPSSRELALAALRAQQIPVIAGALREGVPWGSKSGWVDGYRHDVAFIGEPDAAGAQVLAVMTSGLPVAAADARIQQLTRALLPQVST
jgi:beta-lactamase class A